VASRRQLLLQYLSQLEPPTDGLVPEADAELTAGSDLGPSVFPRIPPEFRNWRAEQRAWRDSIVDAPTLRRPRASPALSIAACTAFWWSHAP
jgi:hypothetical protein